MRAQEDLAVLVEDILSAAVREHRGATRYRKPLVGFAAADDPAFRRLQEAVPGHLMPEELLPGARTVVVYFLPFDAAVVEANAAAHPYAEEWAVAYQETNRLLEEIARQLCAVLEQRGYRAVWQPPTHRFDPQTLTARWSHKSAGYIAGLGVFGRHRMLITPAGCAGRLGSIITDACISPTPRARVSCAEDDCNACVQICPVGAIGADRFDRHACRRWLLANAAAGAQVCGKCATGPCGVLEPDENR